MRAVFVVDPHHRVPDGSLLALLIRSESDVRARHQRASPEVPLAAGAAADPWGTNTGPQGHQVVCVCECVCVCE